MGKKLEVSQAIQGEKQAGQFRAVGLRYASIFAKKNGTRFL